MGKISSDHHDWLSTSYEARNWKQSYGDASNIPSPCVASPVRQLADSLDRALGRYPVTWAAMAWPITDNGACACEQNGSAPLLNFGRYDRVRNATSYKIRVSVFESGTNSTNEIMASVGGSANGFIGNTSSWTNVPRTCEGIRYDELEQNRGVESNSFLSYSINTYGGFSIVDLVAQDDELPELDTDIHEYVDPAQAVSGGEILTTLPDAMRSSMHSMRMAQHGWQSMWLGYGQENAWQYPSTTNQCAIVTTSNTFVNLLNQSWNVRNADSPGIECVAYMRGRGHQNVASGTVMVCSVKALIEINSGQNGGGVLNIQGPLASTAQTVYGNSTQLVELNVGLNTALTPYYTTNGVNKIDMYGRVLNSGTDSLIVRWFTVHSFTN